MLLQSSGPLDQGCQPLIFPACLSAGYKHTLVPVERQKEIYTWFYDQNYTKENASKEFPPVFENFFAKYTKCRTGLTKLLCAEMLPPCFPREGLGYYTLCQPLCRQIADDCPDVFANFHANYVYCARMAEGETSHGFCKHTTWPKTADMWTDFESELRHEYQFLCQASLPDNVTLSHCSILGPSRVEGRVFWV